MAMVSANHEHIERPRGSLSVGELTLDFDRFETSFGHRRIALTPDEFEVLAFLTASANRVLSYDSIALHLWDMTGRVTHRRLNVMVHRIRSKLGDITPYEIKTVRERGYGLLLMDGLNGS